MINVEKLHLSIEKDKTIKFIMDILGNCFFPNTSSLYIKVNNTKEIKFYYDLLNKLSENVNILIKPISFNSLLTEFKDDNGKRIHNTIKFILDSKGIKEEYLFEEDKIE